MTYSLAVGFLSLTHVLPCSPSPATQPLAAHRGPQEIAEARGKALPAVHDLAFSGAVWCALASSESGSTWGDWLNLESWCGGILGTPPAANVAAELFFQGIDHDTPRDWTVHDFDKTMEVLDTDGDGVIRKGEPTAAALAGATLQPAANFVRRTARLLLLDTADRNQDGEVTAAECADLRGSWISSDARTQLVRGWIREAMERAQGSTPRGTSASASVWGVDPGASLAAFMEGLGHTRSSGRIDWLGMEAWFHTKDKNHDQTLIADELSAPWTKPSAPGSSAAMVQGHSGETTVSSAVLAATLEREARAALREGNVGAAVLRLVGLAWSEQGAYALSNPNGAARRALASTTLRVALPAERRPLVDTLAWIGVSLDG